MDIITDRVSDNTNWPQETPVNLSRGKGDWAEIAKAGVCNLAEFLAWQTREKREGSMNAEQYAKSGKDDREADKKKAGWYSLAAYENKHRNGANWRGSNIVILDADAIRAGKEGPQFSFSADDLRQRLDGLQFLALPSHSYTDQIPRWRIVIPLSEVLTERGEFDAIARTLAQRFNSYVDPRSYTPEQLWFSMSAPKGEWDRHLERIVVGG